jgi:diguanylate cyclase (GGDEF)-like protein
MLSSTSPIHPGPTILLASPDPALAADLQRIFNSLGLRLETVSTGDSALSAMQAMRAPAIVLIVLLDVRLPGVASGQLLATMDEYGVHRQCAIALIADQISDNQISADSLARLREGVIDDIVPRNTDASGWNTHLHSMQRGHTLYCELEQLRETTQLEVQHDRVTGVFNRETMLALLFRETDRVQRMRGALSLVLFDLDDFGHWNQELESDACDKLLRAVATRVGRALRSYDLLGRTGVDSLLLALPGCSTINAVMLAERLRVEVFGELFPVNDGHGEELHIRLSACFAITSSRGRSPVVVLREAENTLAQAKLAGPDTLRCTSDSPLAESSAGAAKLFSESAMALW